MKDLHSNIFPSYTVVLAQDFLLPQFLVSLKSLLKVEDQQNIIQALSLGFKNNTENIIPLYLQKKASGGLSAKEFIPSFEQFLISLFVAITFHCSDINLLPEDLFHGHVMFYDKDGAKDIIIIFHAQEYGFCRETYSYRGRNFLWSLSTNKLIRFIKNDSYEYKSLILNLVATIPEFYCDVIEANTIQERYFGGYLFDINYFPSFFNRCFAL